MRLTPENFYNTIKGKINIMYNRDFTLNVKTRANEMNG